MSYDLVDAYLDIKRLNDNITFIYNKLVEKGIIEKEEENEK